MLVCPIDLLTVHTHPHVPNSLFKGNNFCMYFFDPLTIHVLMPRKHELCLVGGAHIGFLELVAMCSTHVVRKLLLLVALPKRLQITN